MDSEGVHRAAIEQSWRAYLMVFARLKDGVTLARANPDMLVLADQTRQIYPHGPSLHRFLDNRRKKATHESRDGDHAW